jgi:hypothetical protein
VDHISGVMLSVVDGRSALWSGKTKNYLIDTCIHCFPAKHAALRSKSKDWMALNQDNVLEWSDMSNRGLFFSDKAL